MSLLPVGFGASGDDYEITDSLRFRSSAAAALYRTFSTPTDNNKWTYSVWFKRGSLAGGYNTLFGRYLGASNFIRADFLSDKFRVYQYVSSIQILVETAAVFRDPSAWYHLTVVMDTSNATSTDRVIFYVNGVRVTAFSSTTYPSLNLATAYNVSGGVVHRIGALTTGDFDGYLTEINFIDGQALTADDFGEYDDNGTWKAKEYTGTYGNNGFYLDATTSGTAVLDQSGNSNNWSSTNMNLTTSTATTYDLMKDTPSLVDENAGNFATLNPLQDSGTLSNANLRMTGTFDNYRGRKGTMQIPSSGKWYWEYNITVQNTGSGNWTVVGVCLNDKSLTGYPAGTGYIGYGERNDGRNINNEGTQVTASSNIDFSTGDVLQVAYDVDTGKFWFGRNNTWFDSSAGSTGNPSTGANATLTAAAKNWHPFLLHFTNNNTTDINFGQQPFKYTPPTGFKKLNTFNLPDSTIEDGSQYFAATTYTGNGSDPQSIGGLNFQPDMVWAKARSVGTSHVLTDAVRGATKTLYPDSTLAEATASLLTAFNSDGFDVSGGLNVASRTLVGWSWKANGSGVSNNVGSIPSTVSANTTAGFSIVSYTGTGATSSGVTIGHGLGATPDVVITKKRSGGTDYGWSTWHKDLGGNYGIWLDKTSARNNAMWDGYTNFSSTVFSPPDLLYGNENGATYINYLFAEVPGYSSFGSYTGNGSAGGPFVYTGFRPAFLVVKNAIVANSWRLWDNERPGYNLTNLYLSPDTAGAEGAINIDVDFLSNGFKIRNTNSSINGSGNNIIYMAFAENPFKNANAR